MMSCIWLDQILKWKIISDCFIGMCWTLDMTWCFSTRYPAPEKPRQKRAVIQDMVRPLKQWLLRHRHNPYPTKAEKLQLAVGSKMTLVQVIIKYDIWTMNSKWWEHVPCLKVIKFLFLSLSSHTFASINLMWSQTLSKSFINPRYRSTAASVHVRKCCASSCWSLACLTLLHLPWTTHGHMWKKDHISVL